MFSLKLYAAMDNELCAGFLIFLHLNSIYQRVAILHFSTFFGIFTLTKYGKTRTLLVLRQSNYFVDSKIIVKRNNRMRLSYGHFP